MNNANLFAAIRGPIMLITVGSLFALDHFGMFGFDRTWPLLIIVFGVMKLLERAVAPPQPVPQPPYPTYPGGPPAPYPGSQPQPPVGGTQQ